MYKLIVSCLTYFFTVCRYSNNSLMLCKHSFRRAKVITFNLLQLKEDKVSDKIVLSTNKTDESGRIIKARGSYV